nr:ribonuclease H-like domain-containing protein [Tanacetum cinerariifolium]
MPVKVVATARRLEMPLPEVCTAIEEKKKKLRRVQRETTRSQKYAYESPSLRSGGYRPHRGSMRPFYRPAGYRPHGPSMNPRRPTMNGGCKITGKGTIKTGKLEFENVYFVKDLKYNMFSVLQIYDNKNSVLFTDTECNMLGRNFKLLDDVNILLRTPRQHNMYSIDLNNIVPHKDLTCLVAKASADECI